MQHSLYHESLQAFRNHEEWLGFTVCDVLLEVSLFQSMISTRGSYDYFSCLKASRHVLKQPRAGHAVRPCSGVMALKSNLTAVRTAQGPD